MMMHGTFILFASLGIGYLLCVLAKKEKGNLKVLGYTLGVSIVVLSFLIGLVGTYMKHAFMIDKKAIYGKSAKHCPMAKMRR